MPTHVLGLLQVNTTASCGQEKTENDQSTVDFNIIYVKFYIAYEHTMAQGPVFGLVFSQEESRAMRSTMRAVCRDDY